MFVLAVLCVSLALRLYIVGRGGALYWTDEKRYYATREAVAAMAAGDWTGAKQFLFSSSEHIGFRWLALPAAVVERAVYGDDPPHGRWCAGWLALFSTANLWLIWLIARRVGTRVLEAEWALAFAASSNALFYFARHCFPYDAALTCFLVAAYLTVGRHNRWTSFLVGGACGVGYLIYNGYWSVGAIMCLLDVGTGSERLAWRLRRALATFGGLIVPIALVYGLARVLGYDLLEDSLRFAHTVNQGDFGEGARFMREYLWAADGGLATGLAVLVCTGAIVAAVNRRPEPWLRWVAAALLLTAIWIFFAEVRPTFVLYGRTVRALVPFLALSGAGALMFLCGRDVRGGNPGKPMVHVSSRERMGAESASRSRPSKLKSVRVAGWAFGAGTCIAGWTMMIQPLRQVFPQEFRGEAELKQVELKRHDPTAEFRTLFADYQYNPPHEIALPPHTVVLRSQHPHQYLPYLYEGYSRADRTLFLEHDAAMRLVRFDRGVSPAPKVATYFGANHGPLELVVVFPANAIGHAETLLAAGVPTIADQLFVSYVDQTHVRFGVDQWGGPPLMSESVTIAPGAEQRIVVSMGALFPPQSDPCYDHAPELRFLERWLHLKVNDTVVFSRPFDFFPCAADTLTIGRSSLGGSNADPVFTGQIVSMQHRAPEELGLSEQAQVWPPIDGERRSRGYLGAVRLTVRLPTRWEAGREPLLVSGVLPDADIVYLRYVGSNRLQLGYRHGSPPSRLSEPFAVEAGTTHAITVSLPSLYPADNRPDRNVRLAFDERPLLNVEGSAIDSSPNSVCFGHFTDIVKTYRIRFGGQILRAELISPLNEARPMH